MLYSIIDAMTGGVKLGIEGIIVGEETYFPKGFWALVKFFVKLATKGILESTILARLRNTSIPS